MARRRSATIVSILLRSILLWSVVNIVSADDAFDCHVTVGSDKWDLTQLAGEHKATRTRDTPPSQMLDELRFDLCGELKPLDGVAASDQCPTGSRACLTTTNHKKDNENRIVHVVTSGLDSLLKPETSSISSPDGLSITFHGASYPSASNSSENAEQSAVFSLYCATDTGEPKFVSWDGKQVKVEWETPSGCKSTDDGSIPPPKEDDKTGDGGASQTGSGVGFFFLVLLLAFIAYFGLGAYYNYSTYGASGVDLIPHRDFWKEVPYMLSDVVSHLCSTVRPRRQQSRSGYIAV